MPSINLGRVGFVNKGNYGPSRAYKLNDIVKYQGKIYACIIPHTSPASGITEGNWQLWLDTIPGVIQDGVVTNEATWSSFNINQVFYTKNETYNKTEIDTKTNINGFNDKQTTDDTDNFAIQETGGLFKKLSFANLKNWILSLFQPILTGTATFTATNNKIVMTGIVSSLGLEVGDVIQFTSGTDAQNAKMRTVESITDNNTIVVNYEHCGSRGNGSLKLSDQSGISCTVKRVAKNYNAPLGLGQDWVGLTAFRTIGTTYNKTTRPISVSVFGPNTIATGAVITLYSNIDIVARDFSINTSVYINMNGIITGSIYKVEKAGDGVINITQWNELR